MSEADRHAEVLRQFQAVISDAGLDDLRQLADGLALLGAGKARERERFQRPDLRRRALPDLRVFRVRVDLKQSKPPIWRRLEVRSDLTLDTVHRVLQAAFGWTDSHLWRFSLGGDPFDSSSQVFLCPWDVEEGEWENEGGMAAAAVRLDETIQAAGEILSYGYDYGDNWELTLRLESVLPAARGTPSAVAVDGRRAAPPEDCGGYRTADELAEVLEDPSHFDVAEVNDALQGPFLVLREHGLDQRLVDVIDRLTYSPIGEELTARALAMLENRPEPAEETLRASLTPFIWFLDRAAEGGIALTASGYLNPTDVAAAAELLPTMNGWIGKANREHDTPPVLHFRKALQSLGLLRKHKGTLQLTRAGREAQATWQQLWSHLADRLVPTAEGFETDATLLLLTYAATSPDTELPLDIIATALTHLGWQSSEGTPIDRYDLYRLGALDILCNIAHVGPQGTDRWRVSADAAELARAALRKPQ